MRILIADDEPAIGLSIRDELVFEGFDIETAATGEGRTALEAALVAAAPGQAEVLPDVRGQEPGGEEPGGRNDGCLAGPPLAELPDVFRLPGCERDP